MKLYEFTRKDGSTFRKWCDEKEYICTFNRDNVLCSYELINRRADYYE